MPYGIPLEPLDEPIEEDENAKTDYKNVGVIPTSKAAKILGVSVPTLTRRARELGGRQLPSGKWVFDAEQIMLTAAKAQGTARRSQRDDREGARAAAIFMKLGEGAQLHDIVMTLGETPEFVKKMRLEWLECQRLDREGVTFTCGCGAPSNPNNARCDRCASRMQPLTDAQRALLAGQEIPEGSVLCSGCGQTHPVDVLDRICPSCRQGRISIVAESGRLRVVLRTGHGPVTLHTATPEESQALAQVLAPPRSTMLTPAAAPPPAVLPDLEKRPTALSQEIATMNAQLAEVNRSVTEARAQFERETAEGDSIPRLIP